MKTERLEIVVAHVNSGVWRAVIRRVGTRGAALDLHRSAQGVDYLPDRSSREAAAMDAEELRERFPDALITEADIEVAGNLGLRT